MKYKMCEYVLTESMNNPSQLHVLGEVEANSQEEALSIAKQLWPHAMIHRMEAGDQVFEMRGNISITLEGLL